MPCPKKWLQHCATILSLTLLVTYSADAEGQHFAKIKEVDLKHPVCEGQLNLKVAGEYFVEIANPLPGKEEYNRLIEFFDKKFWDDFDEGVETFRKVFETSPLVEAVAFLEIQSKLERANGPDTQDAKDAERLLRQALLLYPKSTLVPVITGSLADYWMRNNLSQKSLALYETARREYPFHSLSCMFQLGVAEQNFILKDWEAANATLKMVLQKCENSRVRVGAEIRMADMLHDKDRSKLFPIYEKIAQQKSPIVNRYYSQVLYNLGEFQYQRKKFESSRFYFKEFLKYGSTNVECYPYAMKRVADIALQTNQKMDEVIGLYLTVKEKMSQTDVGRFAYLHALLLGIGDVTEPERERRLKVFDESADKIKTPDLRTMAYLEKGLAMLEVGEKASFDYLLRLHERNDINLEKGELGAFVRKNLLKALQLEAEGALSKKIRKETEKDKTIFDPIEGAYSIWLKGTPFEAKARDFYSKLLLRRYSEALESGKLNEAIEKLTRWKSSPLWQAKGPSKAERILVGELVAKHFASKYPDKAVEVAEKLMEQEEALKPFLDSEFSAVWLATASILKNENLTKKALPKFQKYLSQSAGIVAPVRDDKTKDFLSLLVGKAMAEAAPSAKADRALSSIRNDDLAVEALKARFEMYQKNRNYDGAYDVARKLLKLLPEDQRKEQIEKLSLLLTKGKLWREAKGLLTEVQKGGFQGKELAPYYFLAGRAATETKDCDSAVKSYESALALEPEAKESAEARFRLGTCLLKKKQPEQAKSVWEELIKQNDPFWTPMARNEIRILKK